MKWLLGPQLPWFLLAVVLAVGSAGATGYVRGRTDGRAALEAELARDAAATKAAQNAALQAAAAEIAKLDVKNTTIKQKTEVIQREVPVYRNCRHDPRVLGLLNDALSPDTGSGADGADQGGVPGADAAR